MCTNAAEILCIRAYIVRSTEVSCDGTLYSIHTVFYYHTYIICILNFNDFVVARMVRDVLPFMLLLIVVT